MWGTCVLLQKTFWGLSREGLLLRGLFRRESKDPDRVLLNSSRALLALAGGWNSSAALTISRKDHVLRSRQTCWPRSSASACEQPGRQHRSLDSCRSTNGVSCWPGQFSVSGSVVPGAVCRVWEGSGLG